VRSDRADTLSFPPGDDDGYRPPAQLGVLLPLSGSLASAGASVRDGFLAAYYGESRRRPVVKFYDTRGTGAGAQAAGAQAIAEGAQMLVGPLGRDEVNAAIVPAGSHVPVIALNRTGRASAAGQTSFALLPDDEGADAAQRLLGRGQKQVLVFAGRSDNAQRAATAFRAKLAEGGGRVVGDIAIGGDTPDLSTRLAGLQSGATPAQAVFLALDAGQARAVAAQLKTSAASGLPRIATSLILNGANARGDVELDGIEYPELPWLLGQASGLPDPSGIKLSSARGGASRLFAFGADAWKLAAYFEKLYNDPSSSIRGATGSLQIDVAGPVRRAPAWAVFSGGRGRAH
jgi:outer membrane PBP1 activator LpoA protein